MFRVVTVTMCHNLSFKLGHNFLIFLIPYTFLKSSGALFKKGYDESVKGKKSILKKSKGFIYYILN